MRAAAERADRRNAKITNLSAAQWLHNQRQHRGEEARTGRTALDQLVLASERKPRRLSTRWQATSFQPPDKILRWLREITGSMYLLIFYLRLRRLWERFSVRNRQVEDCSEQVEEQYDSNSSTFVSQIVGVARSCSRTSVHHNAHVSIGVLASSALRALSKRSDQAHPRGVRLYGGIGRSHRDVHGKSTLHCDQEGAHGNFTGSTGEQASSEISCGYPNGTGRTVGRRYTTGFLSYDGVMAWWLLLQSWGTLRFADHRGLEPRNVRFEG